MATWEKGPTTEPRTRDLRPNAEFQPRELRSRSRSFVPHRPLCASYVWSAKHDKSQSVRFPITGPRFSFSIPRFACSSSRFQISSPRFPISSSRFPISSPRFPISSPRFLISSPRFPISSPRFSISRLSKRLCHRYGFHSATSGYHSWILFSEILIVTT